jgi:hypothetical protein
MLLKNLNLYNKVVLGILGFIGVGIILLLTNRFGAGITPDSVVYISAARNLAEGNGFLTYNGLPLVIQPPLYPILLALIKITTFIDPQVSAGYVNAILLGLIVFMSGLLMTRHIKSFGLILLGTISVLISYSIVQTSLMALSESLFIFLTIVFFYYLDKYLSSGNYISLIIFSLAAALACLTRYTGIIIILTGLIGIVVWGKKNIKLRFWDAGMFLLIAIIPIGVWLARNYFIYGTFVGQRGTSSYSLYENIRFCYLTILHWYLPASLITFYFFYLLLIVTSLIVYISIKVKSSNWNAIRFIGPLLIFMIFYSGLIIISSTTTAYDQISNRLLSPIYLPVLIIIFFLTDKILNRLTKTFQLRTINVLLFVGIVFIIKSQAGNTGQMIKEYVNLSGCGYGSESWKKSETIEYLIQHGGLSDRFTLYSNEPEAVYILTNYTTIRSPAKTYYNSTQIIKINPYQKDLRLDTTSACLIWFDKVNRSFLYTVEELKRKRQMTEIAHLNDGAIYTLLNK